MKLKPGNKYLIGKDPIPKTLKSFKWRDGQGIVAIMEDHRGEERPHRLHNCEVREHVEPLVDIDKKIKKIKEEVEATNYTWENSPLLEWRDDFIRATNAMIQAYDRLLGRVAELENSPQEI